MDPRATALTSRVITAMTIVGSQAVDLYCFDCLPSERQITFLGDGMHFNTRDGDLEGKLEAFIDSRVPMYPCLVGVHAEISVEVEDNVHIYLRVFESHYVPTSERLRALQQRMAPPTAFSHEGVIGLSKAA